MNWNPYYNQQNYQQDLLNMRDRIDKQLQQTQAFSNQPQQTPITQNFQLAPSNGNSNGINYVNSIDEVRKELVFNDTLFVDKNYTTLWFKNISGEVKMYSLSEIVELDEKDKKIAELMAKIDMLESEKIKDESNEYITKYVDGEFTKSKSASGKTDK